MERVIIETMMRKRKAEKMREAVPKGGMFKDLKKV